MNRGDVRYKITITATRLEEKISAKDWTKVGPKDGNEDGYGYAPQVIETKLIDREVYSQDVGNLDVAGVICAVNSLCKPKVKSK